MSQTQLDNTHECIRFHCKRCNWILAIGFKEIWEADPDRTGEIEVRCWKCQYMNPIQIKYADMPRALYQPIIKARLKKYYCVVCGEEIEIIETPVEDEKDLCHYDCMDNFNPKSDENEKNG